MLGSGSASGRNLGGPATDTKRHESRDAIEKGCGIEHDVHKLYTQISACRHLFSRFHLYKSWGRYIPEKTAIAMNFN